MLGLLDIGPIEFLILVGAAVMLFGGDLPDVARRAGRAVARLREVASEFTRSIDAPSELRRPPELDLHHEPSAPPSEAPTAPQRDAEDPPPPAAEDAPGVERPAPPA